MTSTPRLRPLFPSLGRALTSSSPTSLSPVLATGAWTAGCLLYGVAYHSQNSGYRLRHSLRVRALPPGHTRWLAVGEDRQVAQPGGSLGNLPAGDFPLRGQWWTHRIVPR